MALQEVSRNTFPQLYNNALNAQLLFMIGKGKESGVHLSALIKATGADNRTVRKSIEHLRRSGVVICADTVAGYYYPENTEELREYIQQEKRRAISTLHTLKTAQRLNKEVS